MPIGIFGGSFKGVRGEVRIEIKICQRMSGPDSDVGLLIAQ